jgi:hypothetical protein
VSLLTIYVVAANRYRDRLGLLDKLEHVGMDASERTNCLPDTRVNILQFITAWVNGTGSKQRMLWLHGLAGSGKSVISTTIANTFRDSEQMGAFLFFDRNVAERNNPMMVIRTLAHQLATFNPVWGAAITAAVKRHPNVLMLPLRDQFQELVLEPLLQEHTPTPIVIILDGLDKCGTPDERQALISVLTRGSLKLPSTIRTIVTSRAQSDTYQPFQPQDHILTYELDITSSNNNADICVFFKHRLADIRTKNTLEPDWPGEEVLCHLVESASGLFVWAQFASEFINGHNPKQQLDALLAGNTALSGFDAALDTMYRVTLESVGRWDEGDFVDEFRDILGTVLVARQPLSNAGIDSLLQRPRGMSLVHTIAVLGSLLHQRPTVRILHPSLADFLMTKRRCIQNFWFFDRSTSHQRLVCLCLDRMDATLKRNMSDITLSADPTISSLPEDISYSCIFWIDHLCAVEEDNPSIIDHLSHFLFCHLLHWFEAMSILGKSRDSPLHLSQLLDWISVSRASCLCTIR